MFLVFSMMKTLIFYYDYAQKMSTKAFVFCLHCQHGKYHHAGRKRTAISSDVIPSCLCPSFLANFFRCLLSSPVIYCQTVVWRRHSYIFLACHHLLRFSQSCQSALCSHSLSSRPSHRSSRITAVCHLGLCTQKRLLSSYTCECTTICPLLGPCL